LGKPTPDQPPKEFAAEIKEVRREAEDYAGRGEIKKHLCASLGRITVDAAKSGQAITGTLIALIIAGQIVMPLNPVLIAMVGLLISKVSVENYRGFNSEKDD